VKEFNERFGVVNVNGKTSIVEVSEDGKVAFWKPAEFHSFYSNLPPLLIDDKPKPASKVWFEHPDRLTYDSITFNPEKVDQGNAYNLFTGFRIEPVKGDCSLYLEHVQENVCPGEPVAYDYLIKWLAHGLQQTQERPEVAVVLQGEQGTGKGVFVKHYGELFKPHYLHITSTSSLTQKFNADLASKLVVFVDEIEGKATKKDLAKVKTIITEPTLSIEPKFVNRFEVNNYVRLFMATNEEWAIPAALEERRFLMLSVGNKRRKNTAFFGAMDKQMKAGGYAALMHHLVYEVDLTGFDVRDVPETKAMRKQKLLSLKPEEKFWHYELSRGDLGAINRDKGLVRNADWEKVPISVFTDDLKGRLLAYLRDHGLPKVAPKDLGVALSKLCPSHTKPRYRVRGQQVTHYNFPKLKQCRDEFEAVIGSGVDWDL
jgi:hypothetical protein